MTKIIFLLFLVTVSVYDAFADIYRPCDLMDYECIRSYLASRSACDPNSIVGPFNSTFILPVFEFATPFYNASYVDFNLNVTNGDLCYVSEFFTNTVTGTIVISITCPDFDLSSTRQLIAHEYMQEDKYYNFSARNVYPEFSTTANLLAADNYDLCASRVSTFLPELPDVTLIVPDGFTEIIQPYFSDLNIYERESTYFRGYQLTFDFVSQVICNFSCEYQRIINY